MRLNPRYGERPILAVEVRVDGPHPVIRQRERLEGLLRQLDAREWRHASRCAGWTVQDVITHLTSTNAFWAMSIQAGVRGEPTRFLSAFDPVATPAQLVDQAHGTSVADTLEQFAASSATLAGAIGALTPADWTSLAEAPPGHLPISLVADHALWDAWIHERDIVIPLGRPAVEEVDEVLTCLRYAAALGRVFELSGGGGESEPVVLEVTEPDGRVVVTVDEGVVRVDDRTGTPGAETCTGRAVDLLEMLSIRDAGLPVPGAIRALTCGLAAVFDQAVV